MAVLTRIYDEQTWEERLQKNEVDRLAKLCHRLNLHQEWVSSNQDYPAFLESWFLAHYRAFLLLLSKHELELLLRIWNWNDTIDYSEINQEHLVRLEELGLIRFSYQEKTVKINREAEQNLYFYLKSKSSKNTMEAFQRLEYAIKGILYQCGIISFSAMYEILKDGPVSITPQFLRAFSVGRMALWGFATVLQSSQGEFLLEGSNVRECQHVLERRRSHRLDYPKLSFESMELLGRLCGVGRWKGVPEMYRWFRYTILKDQDKDGTTTAVFLGVILMFLQNGHSVKYVMDKIQEKIPSIPEEERGQLEKLLRLMVNYIPLYELKGHTLAEVRPIHDGFTVVSGGKE